MEREKRLSTYQTYPPCCRSSVLEGFIGGRVGLVVDHVLLLDVDLDFGWRCIRQGYDELKLGFGKAVPGSMSSFESYEQESPSFASLLPFVCLKVPLVMEVV